MQPTALRVQHEKSVRTSAESATPVSNHIEGEKSTDIGGEQNAKEARLLLHKTPSPELKLLL